MIPLLSFLMACTLDFGDGGREPYAPDPEGPDTCNVVAPVSPVLCSTDLDEPGMCTSGSFQDCQLTSCEGLEHRGLVQVDVGRWVVDDLPLCGADWGCDTALCAQGYPGSLWNCQCRNPYYDEYGPCVLDVCAY